MSGVGLVGFVGAGFCGHFSALLVVGGWWLVVGSGGGGLVAFLMLIFRFGAVWLGLAGIFGWLGAQGFYARGVVGWMRCGWGMVIVQ